MKEEAKRLVERFWSVNWREKTLTTKEEAKQCSKICVDREIEIYKQMKDEDLLDYIGYFQNKIILCEELLKEIDKL